MENFKEEKESAYNSARMLAIVILVTFFVLIGIGLVFLIR